MKIKQVLLYLILCLFMTSCKAATFNRYTKHLELLGNPTTGYSWTYVIGDNTIIHVDENIQYLGNDDVTGAPSLYLYTIESLKPGNTTLKFEYKRYWEEEEPEQERYYEITVKSNGKIKMTEKKVSAEQLSFKSISMTEGLKMMEDEESFILLDVRRSDEYTAGHIPGAVLLTNETMTERSVAAVLQNKEQKIFCYCRSGRRSKLASQKLSDWGYTNVIEIGGILDYTGPLEN